MASYFRRDALRLFSSGAAPPFRRIMMTSASAPRSRIATFMSSSARRTEAPTQSQSQSPIEQALEKTSLTLDSADELAALAKNFDPSTQTGETQALHHSDAPHPVKFFRGPLHPVQPLEKTDVQSREFIPGPFTYPRLMQTYDSTIAPDILTLMYQHNPAGVDSKSPIDHSQRLRRWEGESPYYTNRPARKPRGGRGLDLVRHPIRYDNVPHVQKVIVHSMVTKALKIKPYFDVASMVVQSITNVRCQIHKSKGHVLEWDLKPGKLVAVTATMAGEDMYHFLSKLFDVVLPRVKDWQGVSPKSGDRSGNISFGLTPDSIALFPEIESNFDSYPTEMIPGCHITIQTSATTDRDARFLLSAMGMPFGGPLERSRL